MTEGLRKTSEALGEVSAAAGDLASASANVTVAVTELGVKALTTMTSAAGELLNGVDLLNVSLHRSSVRAYSFSPGELARWIAVQGPFPNELNSWYSQQVVKLHKSVPVFESDDELINVNGSYWFLWQRCRLRADGTAVTVLVAVEATFEPIWANPGWGWVGFEVHAQAPQIVEQLKIALARMQPLEPEGIHIGDDFVWNHFGVGLLWSWWSLRGMLFLSCGTLIFMGLEKLVECLFPHHVELFHVRYASLRTSLVPDDGEPSADVEPSPDQVIHLDESYVQDN